MCQGIWKQKVRCLLAKRFPVFPTLYKATAVGSTIDFAGDQSELHGEGQSPLRGKNALARMSEQSALMCVVSEHSRARRTLDRPRAFSCNKSSSRMGLLCCFELSMVFSEPPEAQLSQMPQLERGHMVHRRGRTGPVTQAQRVWSSLSRRGQELNFVHDSAGSS